MKRFLETEYIYTKEEAIALVKQGPKAHGADFVSMESSIVDEEEKWRFIASIKEEVDGSTPS